MSQFSRLDLENFKSYRLHTTFQWKQVSAIIGQNGKGKSTIVDALEYVFCFPRFTKRSVASLRGELYNMDSGEKEHSSSWVSATINFNNQERTFKRLVDYSNTKHKYWINDKAVDTNEYKNCLLEVNINSQANNFIIQQNSIESLALKNPTQRREFFEILSNSISCKSEYDRLKYEITSLEPQIKTIQDNFQLYKKKEKMLKNKFHEIDQYDVLNEQIKKTEFNYYYLKLYKYKNMIDSLSDQQKEKIMSIGVIERLINEYQEQFNTFKNQIKMKREEVLGIEKHIETIEPESYQLKGIKLSEKKLNLEKQIKIVDDHLEKANKLHQKHEETLADLKEQLHEIEDKIKQLPSQSYFLDTNNDQYEKYLRLIAEAERQYAQEDHSFLYLERQRHFINDQINEYKTQVNTLSTQIQKKQLIFNDIVSQTSNISRKIEDTQLDELRAESDNVKLDNEIKQLQVDIEDVNRNIQILNEKLNLLDITHQENIRHQRQTDIMNALKMQFPGVIGRVIELCSVTKQKYEIAVTKILRNKMDDIIVDTAKTAQECIQFLKDRYAGDKRSAIEKFYPMDNLKSKTIDGNLLREMKRLKYITLPTDVLNFTQENSDTLKSLIGNVVICETDDQAEEFSRMRHINCVTLNGTYYSQDGLFSGGCSDVTKKAKKWNIQEYDKLVKQRKEKTEILKSLQLEIRAKQNNKNSIQIKLSKLKHISAEYLQPALEDCMKKLKEKEDDLNKSKLELNSLETRENSIFELQQSLSEIETKLQRKYEIKDAVFVDFCSEFGLENIQKYEERDVRKLKEQSKFRMELENHFNQINNQLENESNRNTKALVEQYQNKKRALETDYNHCLYKKEKWERERDERYSPHENKTKIKTIRCDIANLEKVLRNSKIQLSCAKEDLKSARNCVAVFDSKIQKFRQDIHEILIKCKVNGIDIPLKGFTISQVLIKSGIPDEDTESSDQLTESESGIREENVEFDFTNLRDTFKNLSTAKVNKEIESLEKKYNQLKEHLQPCVTSNRNIDAELKLLKTSIQTTKNQLMDKVKKHDSLKKLFDEVKNNRKQLLMKFCDCVAAEIDEIFKVLYKNPAAQALIVVSDTEEPYLGGIDLSCLIPQKKFTKIERLSGGEKTVCAIALFFAIYKTKPAPFIIFDEIDVALDRANMGNIIRFVLECKAKKIAQIIIISHNNRFLSCADAIIGINHSTRESSSYAVHVDVAQCMQRLTLAADESEFSQVAE